MSQYAIVPCFKCGKSLRNIFGEAENQPDEGTEFRTYGHYGSTFWDSFDGEQLVLNICDDCLRAHADRLAQHKRFLPVRCEGMVGFGQQWVERPMVPYSGNADNTELRLHVEELGTEISNVEWVEDIKELRADLLGSGMHEADKSF